MGPVEALEQLQCAPLRQYETNRAKLELVWADDSQNGIQWWIEVAGERQSAVHPWSITSMKVSKGVIEPEISKCGLPPQTRLWSDQAWPIQWVSVWDFSG